MRHWLAVRPRSLGTEGFEAFVGIRGPLCPGKHSASPKLPPVHADSPDEVRSQQYVFDVRGELRHAQHRLCSLLTHTRCGKASESRGRVRSGSIARSQCRFQTHYHRRTSLSPLGPGRSHSSLSAAGGGCVVRRRVRQRRGGGPPTLPPAARVTTTAAWRPEPHLHQPLGGVHAVEQHVREAHSPVTMVDPTRRTLKRHTPDQCLEQLTPHHLRAVLHLEPAQTPHRTQTHRSSSRAEGRRPRTAAACSHRRRGPAPTGNFDLCRLSPGCTSRPRPSWEAAGASAA
eukprot:704091-Prymnesium_polylepis.1